ncbi:MAG: carboxypeptidase regulatory-like domain-containing protein [Phycisphaerae bacterium]|nr:carboxypeptidase regulatory-like domain-containing protein [Phycisphaerae bacterium]
MMRSRMSGMRRRPVRSPAATCCCLLWAAIPLAVLAFVPFAAATPQMSGGQAGGGCSLEPPDYETACWLDDVLARAEKESLHVIIEEYPEAGLIVVGFGKGAHGDTRDPLSRGFEYCKMGTGYDGDWNITGEKYCYGPGESVFFGGHYEMLYDGRWCGDGWYRPDGSLYSEDQYSYWIPDPDPYEYWVWYNVVFWYDPMNGSMQQEEGSWTAKWWDNGSNVCSKDFTVMYDLVDDTTSKGMTPDNDPLNRTSTFLVTDPYVYSWVKCDDFSLNFTDDFKWRWYGPEGFYTEIIHDADNPGSGSCWGWYKAWGCIYVDGYYPAEHPGNWYVDVYIKDYNGSWEHKLTHNFTINCVTSGPTITQQPTPPSATICEGQSQHWCVTATGLGSLSYQWQLNTGGGWNNISGATSSCHDATVAGSYRCVVTDACGSTNSSTAFLTVRTAPSITQQPDPPLVVVCDGGSHIWCVQASGSTPLAYQWQRNTGGGWNDIPGEVSSCIQAAVDGSYRCRVSNDCGEIYCDAVTLVVAYAPTITSQPDPPAATICEGDQQHWCVSADGAEPLEYQWEQNTGGGWTLISGATAACYDATQAASYRCGVSNMCGGPVYSNVVTLTLEWGPIIAEIPDHTTLPGELYTRMPQLLQGTEPVSWTLIDGPAGMTVSPATGEVNWPDPTPPDSVHPVVIAATNICGEDQESWQLTVEPRPTYTIGGQVFTDQANPMFSGLPGVTVTVDGDGGHFETETVTGPVAGLWSIDEVPQGQYLVYLEEPGYCFWHFVDGVPGDPPPLSILVNEENQADNQSILFWAQVTLCPGDSNCDEAINWRDIDFFVAAMNDNVAAWEAMFLPGAPTCSFDNNDVNGDGTVNWRDIDPLVAIMNTTCP